MTDTGDIILDVLSDVDPKYIAEHLRRNQPSAKRKIVRYAASAAIYAAACVALVLILPHIIGKAPDGPPTNLPVDPIVTETDVTVSGTETEDETAETVAPPETEADTTAPVILPPETEEPDVVEPPAQTTPAPPITTPAETTTAATTTAPPEPVPEPPGMTHHTDGAVPYSVIRYDSGYISGEIGDLLSSDPVFTNAADFAEFAEKYTGEFYSPEVGEKTLNEFRYFNEAFFEKYNLYLNLQVEGSGSINTAIDEVSVDNGTLCVNINRYEPETGTADMNYILDFIIVEKDIANGSAPKYSYDTFVEVYNYYKGEYEYVPDSKIPEGFMTFIVDNPPEDLLREPVIMRDYAAAEKFLDSVEKLCGGNTGKCFRELPSYSAKSFEKYDYVCIGIYDSDYIYNNGRIDVTLTDGILKVKIPVPYESNTDSGLMNLYVMRFSKNILDGVKEIRLIETRANYTSTATTLPCPKCGVKCMLDSVWVTSYHPHSTQTGVISFTIKEQATKELFEKTDDVIAGIKEKYLSGIAVENVWVNEATEDPAFIEDVASGNREYAMPFYITLEDKSKENLLNVLTQFGCFYCSDFKRGGAVY